MEAEQRGKGMSMKKFVIVAMLAAAANVFAPLMPSAHAATADDVLAQILAQNPNATQAQEILALKQTSSKATGSDRKPRDPGRSRTGRTG
jgi:hypothetical protein